MPDSLTLYTTLSADGRITVGSAHPPLEESLFTVPIALEGGTLLISTTIGVPSGAGPRPLPEFTVVLDGPDLPTWVDVLFGDDVADTVFKALSAPDAAPGTARVELPALAQDRLRAVSRFAEGLWIRRYWPASFEVGELEDTDPSIAGNKALEALPATSTFLTDLELVALAADPLLRPVLGGSPFIAILISLRFVGAVLLFDERDRIARRYRPLALEILRRFFDLASDEDYGASLCDPDTLRRATLAFNTLDRERGRSHPDDHEDRGRPLSAYTLDFAPTPLEDILSSDLALAAGADGQRSPYSDSLRLPYHAERSVIDWTKNIHCLFDPASCAECSLEPAAGKGFTLTVKAPLTVAFPEDLEPEPAYARIGWEDCAAPLTIRLHLDGQREHMEGSGHVPTNRLTYIDVVSVPDAGPSVQGDERAAIALNQEHALDGTTARIRECRLAGTEHEQTAPLSDGATAVQYSWTPPESPYGFPWLSELVAALQQPSVLVPVPPEEGAGLWG